MELTCEICYYPLDEHDRSPCVLMCGHTYCKTCIRSFILRRCVCPKCQKPLGYTNTIDVPVNFFLMSLIESVDQQQICTEHQSKTKEFLCLKCEREICGKCVVKSHLKCGKILEICQEKERIKKDTLKCVEKQLTDLDRKIEQRQLEIQELEKKIDQDQQKREKLNEIHYKLSSCEQILQLIQVEEKWNALNKPILLPRFANNRRTSSYLSNLMSLS